MPYQIQTLQKERPTGREPIWVVRVISGDRLAFSSEGKPLRRAVATALETGVPIFAGDVEWQGDPNDDCSTTIGRFHAHAEHLEGPRRGASGTVRWSMCFIRSHPASFLAAARLPDGYVRSLRVRRNMDSQAPPSKSLERSR